MSLELISPSAAQVSEFVHQMLAAFQRVTHADSLTKVWTSLVTALVIALSKKAFDRFQQWRTVKQFDDDLYTPNATKRRASERRNSYVRPDCQATIPTSTDHLSDRVKIFAKIDEILTPPINTRITVILADTGMGKTTFLEEYYSYHWRTPKRRNLFKLSVVPLSSFDLKELLTKVSVQERSDMVLFLDGIDEDPAAIEKFDTRFQEVVTLTKDFHAIVFTCRTQFLVESNRIPNELGVLQPPGPRPLRLEKGLQVFRIYISPFSDTQIKTYIRRRFPLWRQPIFRLRAGQAVKRFRDLMSRPLLLSFIQDISSSPERPIYAFQIYKSIVNSWIAREQGRRILADRRPDELISFAERVATSLFSRGKESMPSPELEAIAEKYNVRHVLKDARERSLLHNDADGNWKFIHRSIMEYFLSTSVFASGDQSARLIHPWPSQMRLFVSEMLRVGERTSLRQADLHSLDMRSVNLSGRLLSQSDLTNADLASAVLRNADFSEANLTRATLQNADVQHCDFRNACFYATALQSVDLRTARGLTLSQVLTAVSDSETQFPSRTLEGFPKSVLCLALSPDNARLLIGSTDRTVAIWSVLTSTHLLSMRGHTGAVTGVEANSAWSLAVSSSMDGTLRVWNLLTGAESRTLIGHTAAVNGLALSSDGSLVVSVSSDKTLKSWDPLTGEVLFTMSGHQDVVNSVAITPDKRRAISASGDYTLISWNLLDGTELKTFVGHSGAVSDVVLTPDGRRAISASDDKTIRIWDLERGLEIRSLRGHEGPIHQMAMTADGNYVVSASADNTIKVWRLDSGLQVLTMSSHSRPVRAIAVDSDSSFVISASEDKSFRLWFPIDKIDTFPKYAVRNKELFDLQKTRRTGETAEIPIVRILDNSRLVRPTDPQRTRRARQTSSLIMLLLLVSGPTFFRAGKRTIVRRLNAAIDLQHRMLAAPEAPASPNAKSAESDSGLQLETIDIPDGKRAAVVDVTTNGITRSVLLKRTEWYRFAGLWQSCRESSRQENREVGSFKAETDDSVVNFSTEEDGRIKIAIGDSSSEQRFSVEVAPNQFVPLEIAVLGVSKDLVQDSK